MRAKEFINEASGYIPTNSEEAKDPRWSNALSVDVKPGEIQRQGAKMGFDIQKDGRPPLLRP